MSVRDRSNLTSVGILKLLNNMFLQCFTMLSCSQSRSRKILHLT